MRLFCYTFPPSFSSCLPLATFPQPVLRPECHVDVNKGSSKSHYEYTSRYLLMDLVNANHDEHIKVNI